MVVSPTKASEFLTNRKVEQQGCGERAQLGCVQVGARPHRDSVAKPYVLEVLDRYLVGLKIDA